MARAPFQVLVFPYRATAEGEYEFAIFCRSDDASWQGIAGGGEDDEIPLQAARREAWEEAGIPTSFPFVALQSSASVPVTCFPSSYLWGAQTYVIPEYAFGVEVATGTPLLSEEHTEFRWLPFSQAEHILRYDSNRIALWELNQRIRGLGPRS
jgi:dihydroneopterin triphosphate diphosphatase